MSYGDFWIVQVRPSRAPREFQELYQDWRHHERVVLPPPDVKVHFEHNPDWKPFNLHPETKKELARWNIVLILMGYIAPVVSSWMVVPVAAVIYAGFWWVPWVYERLYWWRFDVLNRRSRGLT